MTIEKLTQSLTTDQLLPEISSEFNNSNVRDLIRGMPLVATITNYQGRNPFLEGNPQFIAYVDYNGIATFANISDYYLRQLDPGIYRVNIYARGRTYTKQSYRYCSLEVRTSNYCKFGEPTVELDLLNWYSAGWGGGSIGNDYYYYEDIYPRLSGYLATTHSELGVSDYVKFKVFAQSRDIGTIDAWSEWLELGSDDIMISSLVLDGLYYFEYPLGFD